MIGSTDGLLKKIVALLKSVEHGSFTDAARVMTYSPSAVSRMISELEAEWNVKLLERGRDGVSLTSRGLDLFPYIQNVYENCNSLLNKISELNNLQTGKLRIGTISSVATHLIPNILQEYRREYPRIEFEMLIGDYTQIEQWIQKGRVDIGFLISQTLTNLDFTPLMRDRLLVVLPEGHPMAELEKFPVTSIPDFPFILLQQGELSEITRYFETVRVTPDICLTTLDDYAIMSMVEKGIGISILPELMLTRAPYRIIRKELTTPAYRTLGFAVHDREKAPRMVMRFLELLQRESSAMDASTITTPAILTQPRGSE
jgi:DNA-binding transcriptional LysR family regulator